MRTGGVSRNVMGEGSVLAAFYAAVKGLKGSR
jgi:hypothetical protein